MDQLKDTGNTLESTSVAATSSALADESANRSTTAASPPPTEAPGPVATASSSSTATSTLLAEDKSGLSTEQAEQQHFALETTTLPARGKLVVVDEAQDAGLEFKSNDRTTHHQQQYPSSSPSVNSNIIMKQKSSSAATANATSHHHKIIIPSKDAAAKATATKNSNHRRVSFATNAQQHQISSVPSDDTNDVLIPLKNASATVGPCGASASVSAAAKAAMRSLMTGTPDTFSDASSATSGDGGPWEVIEYDPSDQCVVPSKLVFAGGASLSADDGGDNNDHDDAHDRHGRDRGTDAGGGGGGGGLSATLTTATPTDDDDDDDDDDDQDGITGQLIPGIITAENAALAIEENTPAAEALKASASVKVSRVGKAARAVHMNAVRKLVKRATGTTRSGVVKGKPPRLPPHHGGPPQHVFQPQHQTPLPAPPPRGGSQQAPTIQGGALVGTGGGDHGDDNLSDLIEDDQEESVDEEQEDDDDDNFHDHDYDHDNSCSFQSLDVDDDDGGGSINESQVIQQHADEQKLKKTLPHDEDAQNDYADEEGRVKDHGLEQYSGDGDGEIIINDADEALAEERRRMYREQQQHDHQNTPLPDNVVQGTVEAGKKVLGAVDPHDMLKLLRWRKKRSGSGTNLQTKSYVKGKVIDGEHELYTLSIAVMIGVRTSISKTNTIINSGPGKRWVHPNDFRTTEKYEFRPKGGTGMPAHQLAHTFKFKDYSPVVFAYLRRMSGINEFDFLISVCANANFIEFISNARSGQFFFYSSDGRYMIKTMTNAESKFLRRVLPDYFRHCCKNPNTMITRFFGMYRVKLYHLRRNVKFVIMNSVYYTDKYLQTFYDLKGSSVGRDAKPGQAVLKDNDLRRGLPDEALALSPETRARVRKQVESDCDFLTKMQIMDYSMLVGVHHVPPTIHTAPAASSGGGGGGDDFDKNIATTGFQGSRRRITSDASESMVNNAMGSNNHADHDHLDAMRSSESLLPSHFAPPGAPQPHHSDIDYFYDDGLDDDESSYLQGSDNRQRIPGSSSGGTRMSRSVACDTELKKMATIEKLYWPFHRLYDIHGHRRLEPALCTICGSKPCDCKADPSLLGFHIAEFSQPLSDRKDGGLEMDTSCLTLPMIYKGPQGDSLMYEGKIFYMGIIDILQEYNSRKLLESHYRLMQTSGKYEASCVAPSIYAERFLSFFDEFTKRDVNHGRRRLLGNLKRNDDDEKEKDSGVEMTLEVHSSRSMIEL